MEIILCLCTVTDRQTDGQTDGKVIPIAGRLLRTAQWKGLRVNGRMCAMEETIAPTSVMVCFCLRVFGGVCLIFYASLSCVSVGGLYSCTRLDNSKPKHHDHSTTAADMRTADAHAVDANPHQFQGEPSPRSGTVDPRIIPRTKLRQ